MLITSRIHGCKPEADVGGEALSGINLNLRPPAESLEIFPKHVATDASDRRHWLADIQRRVLAGMQMEGYFKSLVACMAAPIPACVQGKSDEVYETGSPGVVQLHDYGKGDGEGSQGSRYGFAWLKRCSSALLCFTCAPKIRYKRAEEVRRACRWAIDRGMGVMMITFTAPHYGDTDPRRQMEAFNAAKRRFKSGRWWQAQKEAIGYAHSIRALEVTLTHPRHGLWNGSHIHDHGLYFCNHAAFTAAEASRLRAAWIARWKACLAAEGIEIRNPLAFERHALKISLPRARGKVVDTEALSAMADYVADKLAVEISPAIFTKKGMAGGREHINHFEYFALALTRYPQARPYMLRLMVALKGRSWMQWTRGLKAAAGIEEKSDEEVLQEACGEFVRDYDTKTEWAPINRRKLQRRYIRAMLDDGGEAVDAADRMLAIILGGFDPLTGELLE